MEYRVELGKEVLVRTPTVLRSVLSGLPDEWTSADEGPGPGRAVRSEGDAKQYTDAVGPWRAFLPIIDAP
jgi:hypothetical protein